MFVDISDYKSALAIENILTPYKKGRLAEDKKQACDLFTKVCTLSCILKTTR